MNARDPYVTVVQETAGQLEARLRDEVQRGRAYEAMMSLSGWQHFRTTVEEIERQTREQVFSRVCPDLDYRRGYVAAIQDAFAKADEIVQQGKKAVNKLNELAHKQEATDVSSTAR